MRKAINSTEPEKNDAAIHRLDAPLVVAANVRDFSFDKDDVMEALFGKEQITYFEERPDFPPKLHYKPDGVWIQGGYQPRNTRLNAVLVFYNVAPWNFCDASNCLYINSFAGDTELPDVLYRFPHAKAHEGKIQRFEGENIGPHIVEHLLLPHLAIVDFPYSLNVMPPAP